MGDEAKAKLVLQLCAEDDPEHIIEIEDPDVIPTVGDRIDFAGWHGYSAIERNIRFYGSLGPDRQCVVKITLRSRYEKIASRPADSEQPLAAAIQAKHNRVLQVVRRWLITASLKFGNPSNASTADDFVTALNELDEAMKEVDL